MIINPSVVGVGQSFKASLPFETSTTFLPAVYTELLFATVHDGLQVPAPHWSYNRLGHM